MLFGNGGAIQKHGCLKRKKSSAFKSRGNARLSKQAAHSFALQIGIQLRFLAERRDISA